MKKCILSILSFAFASVVIAQNDSVEYYTPSKAKLTATDRVSASISMGAGVSFLNTTKNTAYTTFIAPKIGYQLTPKFKLNIGLMHYSITGNTFTMLNQNEALFNSSKKTISGNLLFVEGQYKLNKKMILSGAVMYDANGFNPNKKDNYKAASIGLEYKTSKHTSLKFETTISAGQGNYYNNQNPYSTGGFNTFGTGFSSGNSIFR
ncbi:MAG: hypothetical protein A3F72_18650 [Bacteroidetes bacterium RIFCSPLOWO2_12_FULL_35_15]|nr:MAG: hypothetical protein A3F72_18650 [Bacteroidetes bacterium RIFCSPLOWO2_12_FULL_35_15]